MCNICVNQNTVRGYWIVIGQEKAKRAEAAFSWFFDQSQTT